MKNYILLIGIAGVALGSYCAYAGNSATMTVTATIAHDVSLSVTQDMDLGIITINPAYTGNDTYWSYTETGQAHLNSSGVISADQLTFGVITANIANPEDCNGINFPCGGLDLTGNYYDYITNIFGGSENGNRCFFIIKYAGIGNEFLVYPDECTIDDMSSVTPGSHSGTLTISYRPE